MSQALRVTELWRYPVKSLQGERLDAAMVTGDGLDGDRRYAIFDLDTGLGLTERRVPARGSGESDKPAATWPTAAGARGGHVGRPVRFGTMPGWLWRPLRNARPEL
jgi:uncharacterized protein YcbX